MKKPNAPPGRDRRLPIWAVILLDIAGLAACLLIFALFHHVLPLAQQSAARVVLPPVQTVASAPIPTAAPTAAPEETLPPAPEETPDPRSPWAIAFAEHFTDTVEITDHSYTSPNVSVTLERLEREDGFKHNVYYVADVYVSELSCLRTYLAKNTFGQGVTEDASDMDAAAGAVLSMTGDFYNLQGGSLVLRNGVLYRDGKWQSGQTHLVLFNDGRMVTYGPEEIDLEAVLAEGAWQIWSFGPVLIENGGVVPQSFPGGMAVNDPNPRSAIGYYEPGHYCFVVCDGRRPSYSYGCTFEELAQVFSELGCQAAYNLDGGGSAVMLLNGALANSPSGSGRALSDIILVGEPLTPEDTEGGAAE